MLTSFGHVASLPGFWSVFMWPRPPFLAQNVLKFFYILLSQEYLVCVKLFIAKWFPVDFLPSR